MGKLCLLIADKDEIYLKRLGDYLMIHYSARFNIHMFSSSESLSCYYDMNGREPDVLLISSDIAADFPAAGKARAVMELSENNLPASGGEIGRIFKYQHCESLVKDMLHIYAGLVQNTPDTEGKRPAMVYAVHSASGGSGCTSMAVALSILAARRNYKSLYISLEGTSSAYFHFKGHCERTFSDILYYLKEGGSNLCMKLESGCCCDPASGVHYFLPPDSISEFDELTEGDIRLLLETLKASALFDMVFIDLPPGLSRRNCLIYDLCDRLINVCANDALSLLKKGCMEKDPGLVSVDYISKTLHVINRYTDQRPCSVNGQETTFNFDITVKESEIIGTRQSGELLTDVDPSFTASVARLLDLLTTGGTAHA